MNKRLLLILFCFSLIAGMGLWTIYKLKADSMIESAYNGHSFDYLNKLIKRDRLKDIDNRTLGHYLDLIGSIFNRVMALYFIVLTISSLALVYGRQKLHVFLRSPTHPLNLAVFRIVLFSQILSLNFDISAGLSGFSSKMLVPPTGWGWALDMIPLDSTFVSIVSTAFQICCVTSLLGLFGRVSIPCATLLGLYAMGLPQFFGKIDHYHHLWWFMMLLSFSPCADALSLDSLIKSLKHPGLLPRTSSLSYAIPLRLAWLLMGVLYFFPGFWKFVISGTDWALSENLKFKMYSKWFVLGGWEPILRIDQYPFLYKSGAVATVLFELGFVFALLFPTTRIIFAVWGVLFHQMTRLFMNISFSSLVALYVAFIDWHSLCVRLGRMIFREKVVVNYSPDIKESCQFIAILKVFDLFESVDYAPGLPANKASVFQVNSKGSGTWYVLFKRIPLALLATPLLLLVLAKSRFLSSDTRPAPSGSKKVHGPPNMKPIFLVGSLLIGLNFACGIALIDSWPFAVYPTFASIEKSHLPSIVMVAYDGEKNPIAEFVPLSEKRIQATFRSPARLYGFIKNILTVRDASLARGHMMTLWELWKGFDARLVEARSVRFYRAMFSTVPEDGYRLYRDPQLLLEFEVP